MISIRPVDLILRYPDKAHVEQLYTWRISLEPPLDTEDYPPSPRHDLTSQQI
jgi:hypothetical protein